MGRSSPSWIAWQNPIPATPTGSDDLSVAYNKVGDVQEAQGDLTDALASYLASLAVMRRLTKFDPDNTNWQRDLFVAYSKVGDVQRAQGDLPAALTSLQAALAIIDRLAKSDTGNAVWQRDLAAAHVEVGDVQMAQGDLASALISYQRSVAIRERLTNADARNASWQYDLAVSYNRMGDVELAQDDATAALTSYQALLTIMDHLAKSDTSNTSWRRGLSIANDKAGQALFDLGRVAEAVNSFTAALQSAKAPDNAEFYWRRALAKLYMNDAAAAADDAAMALQIRPAYPYYPIWLHIARARAGQPDGDELAANTKGSDRSKWPWPIVALFLGSITPDDASNAAMSAEQQRTRAGQSCEADFYIGVYQAETGARADARPLFQSAVDHCPKDFTEYQAAKFELKRLDELSKTRAEKE